MANNPAMNLVDAYASVVADLKHEPTVHVFYGEKTVATKDGLHKF